MAVTGWQVYNATGALGKREMTIASLEELPNRVLQKQQLKTCDLQSLIKRWHAGEWIPYGN